MDLKLFAINGHRYSEPQIIPGYTIEDAIEEWISANGFEDETEISAFEIQDNMWKYFLKQIKWVEQK